MESVTADVRKVQPREAAQLACVLARAFEHDAMSIYLFPDPARRLAGLEQAFRLYLERIFLPQQECYTVAGLLGGAVWLPAGGYPIAPWHQLRLLPGLTRIFGLVGTPAALRAIGQLEQRHPTERAHWYLAFLGVDPRQQGQGLGSALLRPVLDRCDAARLPAYLETANARNLPLYHRHGFAVRHALDLPHGPHVWGMWREPKA